MCNFDFDGGGYNRGKLHGQAMDFTVPSNFAPYEPTTMVNSMVKP